MPSFRAAGTALLSVAVLAIACPTGVIASQSTDETIIVRGTRIDPAEARQRAVDFVKSTGVANGQKQVARWVVPVCIKVIGVSTVQEAKVTGQMLAIAREADIPIGKADCEPNLTVTFAEDAGYVVRHINARKPRQFRELNRTEKEQLLNGSAPVRWWYATEMMDRDGVKSNNISPGWIGAGEGSGVPGNAVTSALSVGGEGDITSTQQYNSGSNVRTPTVRSLYGATVIVDATKAGSTPIDAISAYAAMVAFAEMDAGAPPPDSILGLFQPDSVESTLTDWDIAFLKSLYRMPLDRRSRIQRGHLVEALLDERLPKEGMAKKP
jgi:hypothetical protein